MRFRIMAVTSLSAGLVIYDILSKDADVMAMATKVFPVVTDSAELPYVAYRRTSLSQALAKGTPGAGTVTIEVNCYAATYDGSIALAEAVRSALDNYRGDGTGVLRIRSCALSGSEEYYEGDAYVQALTFEVKI